MQAEPWWPVVVLVVIQVGDGAACAVPTRFITAALDRVDCPAGLRPVLAPLKLASAAGLVVGLWVPVLGLATALALVAYFLVAIAFHVRARDSIVSSSGAVAMLALVVAVASCFA